MVTIRNARSTCCIPRNQEHISYRSPVRANLLLKFSNFRCHGNQGRSAVTANDTIGFAAIENPLLGARIRNVISHRSSVMGNFLLKISNFRYHGNMGWSGTNLAYTVKYAVTENPLIGAIIGGVSSIQAEL